MTDTKTPRPIPGIVGTRQNPRMPLALRERDGGQIAATPGVAAQVLHRAEGTDTMLAWERFLTGGPLATPPTRNFVVASWLRSNDFGIDPRARASPRVMLEDSVAALRERYRYLIAAACPIFADTAELLTGTRSILVLTTPDGVVLEAVGDTQTLSQGENIHLMQGGDWAESTIGTNGIGTALATGRPAQVHAAEHFCEGIKSWTCAAAPILDLTHGTILGVVDISGPPSTYQRTNLTLAVSIARQIETSLEEMATRERVRLLEACLERMSSADVDGLLAIDRNGRLIHCSGRAPAALRVGQCLPGLGQDLPVDKWSDRLPEGLRAEWFDPITVGDRAIGAMVVIPGKRTATPIVARPAPHSEADPDRNSFAPIVGDSPALRDAVARSRQLADKRVSVLLEGETGVGKELFARAMHGDSPAPFVAYNCGAASRELIAGELFGHVRGAYTGATSEGRPGRFELANNGTLCLDEIGELPLDLQPLLLRVLEEGVVYRLGSAQPRRVEVRLLALTNRALSAEVEAGRFRRDLYHRIAVTRVRIPPLREREGDVDRLIEHFNRRLATRHELAPRRYGSDALAYLRGLPWTGNVRELRNVVEGLLLTASGPVVTIDEIRAALPQAEPTVAPPALAAPAPVAKPASGGSLDEMESAAIVQAVIDTSGNLALAARLLGISRSTLYRKAARFGINLVESARRLSHGRRTDH